MIGGEMKIVPFATSSIPLFLILLICSTGCRSDEARNRYSVRALVADPEGIQYYNDAKDALDRKAYAAALVLVDSALAHASDIPQVQMLYGHILFELARYNEAHLVYQKVVELDPEFQAGWFTLGNSAFFGAQYQEAIPCYRKEIDMLQRVWARNDEPVDESLLSTITAQIGRAYARLGVVDSARMAYEQAIEKDSLNATALSWLGELYQEEGKVEEALPYARRALNLDQDNTDTQYLVGVLLFRTGRLELAQEYLEDVVTKQPWHEGATYNLGRVLVLLGQDEEGQAYLDKTDELQARHFEIERMRMNLLQYPNNPAQWIRLGELLRVAGREAEAGEAFHIARELER